MRICPHLRIALVWLAFRLHSLAQEVLAVKSVGNMVLALITASFSVFSSTREANNHVIQVRKPFRRERVLHPGKHRRGYFVLRIALAI